VYPEADDVLLTCLDKGKFSAIIFHLGRVLLIRTDYPPEADDVLLTCLDKGKFSAIISP